MITTKKDLLNFIAENHGINVDIKETDELNEDLGFDELDFVELVMALEEKFNIFIPDEDAEKWVTVKDIIDYLESKKIILL